MRRLALLAILRPPRPPPRSSRIARSWWSCSPPRPPSCPPADAFLAELAHGRTDVLPLGFHVTYWNGLGWRDPFSLDAATARQRHYAALFAADGVYTPQLVIDGKRDVVGSDRASALDHPRRRQQGARRAGAASRARQRLGHARRRRRAGPRHALADRLRPRAPHRHRPWREHRPHAAGGQHRARHRRGGRLDRRAAACVVPSPQGERVAAILQAEDGSIIAVATAEETPSG